MKLTNLNEITYGEVLITGTAQVGQTLSASNTLDDPDGLYAVRYNWFRNGQLIDLGNPTNNIVTGLMNPKEVKLSPDGNHAYVTSNTKDAVSWYDRNATTGELSFKGFIRDGLDGAEGLDGARGLVITRWQTYLCDGAN